MVVMQDLAALAADLAALAVAVAFCYAMLRDGMWTEALIAAVVVWLLARFLFTSQNHR